MCIRDSNNSVLKINQKYVKENKILKQLKTKLNDNNALVTKPDKGLRSYRKTKESKPPMD